MAKTRNRGRKSNPDAKRKQTTAVGQGRISGPTPELIDRRRALTGDGAISETLPLLALKAGLWITQDMYDAGWEFAQDAWSWFGPPDSCAPTYEKLIAGFFDRGGAPTINPDRGHKRLQQAEQRYKRAVAILIRPGESRRVFNQVVRATRDLQFPAYVVKVLQGRNPTSWEAKDFGRLMVGLARLSQLRNKRKSTTNDTDKEAA